MTIIISDLSKGTNDAPRDSTRLLYVYTPLALKCTNICILGLRQHAKVPSVLRTTASASGRHWVFRKLQLTKETVIHLFRRFAGSAAFLSHIFRLGIPSGWRVSSKGAEGSQNREYGSEFRMSQSFYHSNFDKSTDQMKDAWYTVRRTDVYSVFDLQKKTAPSSSSIPTSKAFLSYVARRLSMTGRKYTCTALQTSRPSRSGCTSSSSLLRLLTGAKC